MPLQSRNPSPSKARTPQSGSAFVSILIVIGVVLGVAAGVSRLGGETRTKLACQGRAVAAIGGEVSTAACAENGGEASAGRTIALPEPGAVQQTSEAGFGAFVGLATLVGTTAGLFALLQYEFGGDPDSEETGSESDDAPE